MRGRKQELFRALGKVNKLIKKESPNEGTETRTDQQRCWFSSFNKKRIPEWGDGNETVIWYIDTVLTIKKESPNEGTETRLSISFFPFPLLNKKRIPEWGDGNRLPHLLLIPLFPYKKRIPEWGDGNSLSACIFSSYILDKKRIPEWGDGNTLAIMNG